MVDSTYGMELVVYMKEVIKKKQRKNRDDDDNGAESRQIVRLASQCVNHFVASSYRWIA